MKNRIIIGGSLRNCKLLSTGTVKQIIKTYFKEKLNNHSESRREWFPTEAYFKASECKSASWYIHRN